MASEDTSVRARAVSYASWSDFKHGVFKALFGENPVTRGRFLFRGQRDFTWPLASSFDRSFPKVVGKARNDLERALLKHFRVECEADPELRELVKDEHALIALAQHSGLPTRLLDWSESPYVAAFFAFQHAISAFHSTIDEFVVDRAVAIWALDSAHYIWSEDRGVQVLSPPSWHNTRMRLQSGRFTLSKTPFRSLEEYTQHFCDGADALHLFLVEAKDARYAMADLDMMGINHSSLFPGPDGRAKAAISKVVLGSL